MKTNIEIDETNRNHNENEPILLIDGDGDIWFFPNVLSEGCIIHNQSKTYVGSGYETFSEVVSVHGGKPFIGVLKIDTRT